MFDFLTRFLRSHSPSEQDSAAPRAAETVVERTTAELERQLEALRHSEEHFRLLIEGTTDYAIFVLDATGRVVSWNPGAERIKQYQAPEIIGRNFSCFYTPEEIQAGKPEEALRLAAAEGRFENEAWRLRKDGSRFWASVIITPLRNPDGSLRGFSKITRDLTERKQAEENTRRLDQESAARRAAERYAQLIQQQKERLRVTLASIGDAVITTDAEGRITLLNRVAENLTGWTNAEATGRLLPEVFRIVNEQTRELVEDPVAKVLARGGTVGLANHTVLIARDGRERPIDDSAAPIPGPQGQVDGVVLVFRDVSQRRRDEATLRWQADLLEQAHDAIFVWQLGGPIVYWNRAGEQLYGYTKKEALAKSSHQLLRTIHPQGSSAAFEAELERQGEFVGELIHTRRDGARITVDSRTRLITQSDGSRYVLETSRDITERKRAEEALRDADRRKNEFLATLAHELRNPLAPLRNALELLRRSGGDEALLGRAQTIMERQLEQMVRLVDDLLDIGRISSGKVQLRKERGELAPVLRSTLEAVRPLIESQGHELTVTQPPEALFLEADPTRLAQVIANLLNNAAKYTDRGGHIWLTAQRQRGEVTISVRDTGIGIAAEHLPHLFEMFSQAAPALERSQGGLGIGLSLVRALVELHGGRVEAHSAGIGHGSEFVVRLPLVEPPDRAGPPEVAASSAESGTRTARILVVDDNRDAADSTALMLSMQGHELRIAYDGLEAVQAAADFHPDIVLLDIGLPKMHGYDVARAIRQQPGGRRMVLIALTGWGQEEDKRRAMEAGFDYHLTKPVEAVALERLLALAAP